MSAQPEPPEAEPFSPMLARLVRDLPTGDGIVFEPKWDGFRCLAARSGADVDLRSRNARPLSRYFPEVVAALQALPDDDFIADGELLIAPDGMVDFAALMARLHPAPSRVARLAEETPASYVVFDLVRAGGTDLVDAPFRERRRRLEALLERPVIGVVLTPVTSDRAVARRWLDTPPGRSIDGVMVKDLVSPYTPGRRTMLKVKRERTVDCVVAGLRGDAPTREVRSLLLGLYDRHGTLRHVGVTTSLPKAERRALVDELLPGAVPLEQHPWRDGYALEGGPMGRLPGAAGRWTPQMGLDWVPLAPVRVAEVAYNQVDGIRFRHPARFRRWRPDRDAATCRTDQLEDGG
jgi:ATP-dependent DNA ligase